MDNRFDRLVRILVQPRPQTGFMHVLHEGLTDQIFPFDGTGDIVHEHNVVTIKAVQCRQRIAADKPRSSGEYDHLVFLDSRLGKNYITVHEVARSAALQTTSL
jgi:hypothetical protein